MSATADQLAAVRDLVGAVGKTISIGGREVKAFVGYLDAETGLPVAGGGTITGRSVSLICLSPKLPELRRDLPVSISPSVRAMKIEAWEDHDGFHVIETR